MKRILCVVGPTGAGKSAAALALAETFGGVVINADSRQVYRDFPLITARPGPEDEARCPHRLYGFLPTEQSLSAGIWADMALEAVRRAQQDGLLPILTGGTGLYLRALLDGMTTIPPIPDDIRASLAAELARCGPEVLHARLSEVDPDYAARIHPRDRQRVLRALEVHAATGQTFSDWHRQTPPPLDDRILRLGLGLPLADLTPLLARRVDVMLASGALDEAREARLRCPDGTAPGWSGIGCAELWRWLCGELDLDEARRLWVANTRAYAKRQWTWFRADPRLHWFSPQAGHLDAMRQAVETWLEA